MRNCAKINRKVIIPSRFILPLALSMQQECKGIIEVVYHACFERVVDSVIAAAQYSKSEFRDML